MKPTITAARHLCGVIGARQVVVVAFEGEKWSVVSYGATKEECEAVKATCDAIADGLLHGAIPGPMAKPCSFCRAGTCRAHLVPPGERCEQFVLRHGRLSVTEDCLGDGHHLCVKCGRHRYELVDPFEGTTNEDGA